MRLAGRTASITGGTIGIGLATALALIASCMVAVAAEPKSADAIAIEAAAARWADAYNHGDTETIASLYTEDAQLLPEGREAVIGRAAILEFFQKTRSSSSAGTIRFSNFEFYGQDPVITEQSDVEIRDRSGKVKSRSKQVLIRLKQNGEWKIHRDIWTTNGPVPSN